MDAPRMNTIVDAFVPIYPINVDELRPVAADELPLFIDGELKEASGLMKTGKSPGPHGVPIEIGQSHVFAHGYIQEYKSTYRNTYVQNRRKTGNVWHRCREEEPS